MDVRRLQKWHGAGNDFLVDFVAPEEGSWWNASRARAVLVRSTGVGADGLLVGELSEPLSMTLYNADGTQAEMSGNGIRCLGAALARRTQRDVASLDVMTLAGLRTVHLTMNQECVTGSGSTEMGEVVMGSGPDGTLGVASVGNPHVVVVDRDEWSDSEREELADRWSTSVGGANVEFIRVVSRRRLALRVIERGVGWTLACGTGSVASVALAHANDLVDESVIVENPGGELTVTLKDEGAVLAGPVTFVADVEWCA